MKIRSRKFDGRCARHKSFNPAVDSRAAIVGGCPRCTLLCEIWETSLHLNKLIRGFDPRHDDLRKPPAAKVVEPDPRQMSLIEASQ